MRLNFQYAIGMIAALSLLLGLSIGQLHHQQQEIETLKQRVPHLPAINVRSAGNLHHIQRYERIRQQVDQARRNMENARREREKACRQALEAASREVRKIERDKTYIILQEEL